MGRALRDELRSRVLAAAAEGISARKAATRFDLGGYSAIRWIARARYGECRPRRLGRRGGSSPDAPGGMTAPMQLDGAMNRIIFQTYVDRVLVPTPEPGDIAVMDNLSAQKAEGIRKVIEQAGAELYYVPTYSHGFNPIEMAFSKPKALLRARAERTIHTLWGAVADVIRCFTPHECANHFATAGYAPAVARPGRTQAQY